MKVVHLVHNFPPEFTGGTERYLSSLVRLQQQEGVEAAVVSGSEILGEQDTQQEDWHGVPVHRLPRRPEERFGVIFELPRLRAVLAGLLARLQPDLIHLHHWFHLSDDLVDELPPVPLVATLHDSYALCPRFFLLRPADGGYCGGELPIPVERCVECVRPDDGGADLAGRLQARRRTFARAVQRLDRILVPSEAHGRVLTEAGLVPASKRRVLPLGIEAVGPVSPHDDAAGKLRLVTFGNLSFIKGVDLLLEAVAGLRPREAVEVHLFGPLLAADEAALRARGERVAAHFHGPYDLDRLRAHAPRLDLAVFPSRAYETYSLVRDEAVALGLPLVVSNRGALPERVGNFGRVVSLEEPAALRSVLQELLDHPEALARMRAALPEQPTLLAAHERELRILYHELVGSSPE